MTTDPDTADVLFTRGPSFFNRLTCKLTGPASHQALFFDSEYVVEASAESGKIEKVATKEVFDDLKRRQAEWIVFSWIRPEMNPARRARIQIDLCEATLYQRYSYVELPLQVMDTVLNRYILRRPRQGIDAKVFRKLGDIWDKGVICSKTSNMALINNGYVPATSGLAYGSPSDTYRWLMKCQDCVILKYSAGWFDYPGSKKDELGRAALPGLVGVYPWRKSF